MAAEVLSSLLDDFWFDDVEAALAWAKNLHGEQARKAVATIKLIRPS